MAIKPSKSARDLYTKKKVKSAGGGWYDEGTEAKSLSEVLGMEKGFWQKVVDFLGPDPLSLPGVPAMALHSGKEVPWLLRVEDILKKRMPTASPSKKLEAALKLNPKEAQLMSRSGGGPPLKDVDLRYQPPSLSMDDYRQKVRDMINSDPAYRDRFDQWQMRYGDDPEEFWRQLAQRENRTSYRESLDRYRHQNNAELAGMYEGMLAHPELNRVADEIERLQGPPFTPYTFYTRDWDLHQALKETKDKMPPAARWSPAGSKGDPNYFEAFTTVPGKKEWMDQHEGMYGNIDNPIVHVRGTFDEPSLTTRIEEIQNARPAAGQVSIADDWRSLGLKRALAEAADRGSEYIELPTHSSIRRQVGNAPEGLYESLFPGQLEKWGLERVPLAQDMTPSGRLRAMRQQLHDLVGTGMIPEERLQQFQRELAEIAEASNMPRAVYERMNRALTAPYPLPAIVRNEFDRNFGNIVRESKAGYEAGSRFKMDPKLREALMEGIYATGHPWKK